MAEEFRKWIQPKASNGSNRTILIMLYQIKFGMPFDKKALIYNKQYSSI